MFVWCDRLIQRESWKAQVVLRPSKIQNRDIPVVEVVGGRVAETDGALG